MSAIRVYIEGDRQIRAPFVKLLGRATGENAKVRVIACGGRDDTIRAFSVALRQHPTSRIILLLDSDGPDDGRCSEQLRARPHWQRHCPDEVCDEQLCWMVQITEAWFLADRSALRQYYGDRLHEASLPANPNVEQLSASDVLRGLKRATRNTGKGEYVKGKHAPRILELLDASAVAQGASNFRRLIQTITS